MLKKIKRANLYDTIGMYDDDDDTKQSIFTPTSANRRLGVPVAVVLAGCSVGTY